MKLGSEQLLQLHVEYYAISRRYKSASQLLGYAQFLAALLGLEEEPRKQYVEDLHQRYEKLVAESVTEGFEVLTEYLLPEKAINVP